MIRISTKGRYALRVLVDLAEHQSVGYIPLKEIAARQGISEKYLESILRVLTKERYLLALRGKGGGYQLAKPPQSYTVAQILKLTEGNLAPVACLECKPNVCQRAKDCRTLPMWKELDAIIDHFFSNITLADLVYQPSNNFIQMV